MSWVGAGGILGSEAAPGEVLALVDTLDVAIYETGEFGFISTAHDHGRR